MARRSRDWNEGLAQDLRDQEFAREFLLAAMDEGVPIQVALGKVIRAMGVKEFAAKVKMAGPNVLRAINPRHNPTHDTMDRLPKPFRLKLSLARVEEPQRGATRRWSCEPSPSPDFLIGKIKGIFIDHSPKIPDRETSGLFISVEGLYSRSGTSI